MHIANQKFSLVVVGASLGGMKALETLLPGLPADFPPPIAVVIHRGRLGDESLATHLQKFSALPVREVEDKDLLTPGRIFLAPADYHLLIEDDHFALSADAPVNHARPAIDVLFESAAAACDCGMQNAECGLPRPSRADDRHSALRTPHSAISRVLGLILTGASDDGARGLAAIQARGGLALVQDPATAECRAMPDAALAAVPAAQVLPLDQIAAWLGKHHEI